MEIPEKANYRPDEVATILRVSCRTIYRMIREGNLEAVRYDEGPWRIPKEALEQVLKGER